MKRTHIGGLLAAVTLFGGLALTSTTASAIVDNGETTPQSEVCYSQIPEYLYEKPTTVTQYKYQLTTSTVEREYKKTVETPKYKTEYQYQKQTKTTVEHGHGTPEVVSDWSWWSPASFKWSSSNVAVLETGNHGNWTESHDPPGANHKHTDYFDRDYRYVENGVTRQVPDGVTVTREYQWSPTHPGAPWKSTGATRPGTPVIETTGWVTESPGEGWVQIDEQTVPGEPESSGWVRETLATPWELIGNRGVDGERIPCDEKPENYSTNRETSEPCTAVGQTATTATVYAQDWTHEQNDDFGWFAVKDGDEYVVETYVRNLTDEEKAGCPTLQPTPTLTPIPTPEIQTSETPEQAQLPPVPSAPAAAVAATPTQLPSTGNPSWALALVALTTLLGGTGLVRLSRRPND